MIENNNHDTNEKVSLFNSTILTSTISFVYNETITRYERDRSWMNNFSVAKDNF